MTQPPAGVDAAVPAPGVKPARRTQPAVAAAGVLLALGVALAAGYAAVRSGLVPFGSHDEPEPASPAAAQAPGGAATVAEERPEAPASTLATPDPEPAQKATPPPDTAAPKAKAIRPSTTGPPRGATGRQASGAAKPAVPGAPPPPPVTPESAAAPRTPPGPIRVGGSIRPPIKTRHVAPVYPSLAKSARIEGVVIIEATIGANGLVSDAKVLRSIAPLDQAALDAVRQWQYSPTRLNGVPVPVVLTVSVSFSLR